MNDTQQKELEKHHARINDQGESLIIGSIPWLINEIELNLNRVDDLISDKDRTPKKVLRAILKDLNTQIRELKRRLD